METNKYINLFKEKIDANIKEYSLQHMPTVEYYENLYDEIRDDVQNIAKLLRYPSVDDDTLRNYFEIARKEYLSVNPIDIDPASSLTKDGLETWLTPELEESIDWNYATRYLNFLYKSGRSENVVNETRASSLLIMGKLGDPRSSNNFYRKGLVVGDVQSGKTGNFNAVINRAIDCGYGLIIVLSGIMEDLRSQTQQRIESDVIGEGLDIETQKLGRKGVGNIERFGHLGNSDVEQVVSVTSSKSDFNKPLADAHFSLNHTNVLVCKKNISVLKNLIVWLHDYLDQEKDKHKIPLLILDDEADNASLNNEGSKGREYASKINGHIRALLQLFHKKTYLGYTATPFANVLQDRNAHPENDWVVQYKLNGSLEEKRLPQVPNLFPDDFIVLLSPPSNYIGAKQIFETIEPIDNSISEKIPLVCVVDDSVPNFPARVMDLNDGRITGVENFNNLAEWNEKVGEFGSYSIFPTYKDYKSQTRSSRKTDPFPVEIPLSLKEAILCFVLAIAVRESRKPMMINSALYQPHNSMLIHISRFTAWQNKTLNLINRYVDEVISSINNDDPDSRHSIYFELENIWYSYYANIVESIRNYLPKGYVDDFMTPIVFESLKTYLPRAVSGIEVKAINSVTKDKLEYAKTNPKKVIAIGGNRLSRGFTLEGLTINYFVRNTNYSDTLLQMGRWFGYRPGYLDCCKLFTTPGSIEKFDSTTRCIEELENEFKKMEDQNKTPENFILRVKKHPGVLKITRPSILKNTVDVKWSYQDQLEMTTTFNITKEKIEKVWEVFKRDIAPIFKKTTDNPDGFLTFSTDGKGIISLLEKDNNFEETRRRSMITFIKLCLDQRKLMNWTVALKTTGAATEKSGKGILTSEESGLPRTVNLSIRRGPGETQAVNRKPFLENNIFKATGKSANIVSASKDLSILLPGNEIEAAEKAFRANRAKHYMKKNSIPRSEAKEKAAKVNIPERVYRERMNENEGLLIIYLFDSYYSFNQEKGKEDEDAKFSEMVKAEDYNLDIPIVGYAIGFPPIENDPGGEYVQGDYDLDSDEEIFDGLIEEEDLELPSDSYED